MWYLHYKGSHLHAYRVPCVAEPTSNLVVTLRHTSRLRNFLYDVKPYKTMITAGAGIALWLRQASSQ